MIGPLLMSNSCTASALQYAVGRSLAACLRNTGKDVHVLLQLHDKSECSAFAVSLDTTQTHFTRQSPRSAQVQVRPARDGYITPRIFTWPCAVRDSRGGRPCDRPSLNRERSSECNFETSCPFPD